MISFEKPENFNPKFEVVSCFVEYDGKILLLHRQDYKPQGGTWGAPAGKIDPGENAEQSVIREIFEEIGLVVKPEEFIYIDKVFVRYPTYDFIYHMFSLKLNIEPVIQIRDNEHKDFQWIGPKEALKIDLIQDMDFCIKHFYNI